MVEDFIGELLERIDTSGENFSQRAFETLARTSSRCCAFSSSLRSLFYGVQLLLGTSRISVAEIIGRIARVFWSSFRPGDLVGEL